MNWGRLLTLSAAFLSLPPGNPFHVMEAISNHPPALFWLDRRFLKVEQRQFRDLVIARYHRRDR